MEKKSIILDIMVFGNESLKPGQHNVKMNLGYNMVCDDIGSI